MLSKKNILVICAVVVTIVGAALVFSLVQSRPSPSPSPLVTPSATPGPDGKAFTEQFLQRYGNFDGNRDAYVAALRPMLTPQLAETFFSGPGAVDGRIRRTAEITSLRKVSERQGRATYQGVLQTENQIVGQKSYQSKLTIQMYLTLQDGLWKVSDMQFKLNNG